MSTKKILIVEDEPLIQEYFEELLIKEDFNVFLSSNGEEAINLMKKNVFDLILLDIMMPIMDGITLLTKMKEGRGIKDQGPVILLTNLEPRNVRELQKLYEKYDNKPESIGVHDHFVKANMNNTDFIRRINKIFIKV